jgi:hypothetical protein
LQAHAESLCVQSCPRERVDRREIRAADVSDVAVHIEEDWSRRENSSGAMSFRRVRRLQTMRERTVR